jgi:O-succinylbenzoic acid--CoA ligase
MDTPLIVEDGAGNSAMLNPALGHDGEALLAAAGRHGLRDHKFFATSGVSGRTKFVCLSKGALLASARAVNAFYGATSGDRWVCVLPPFHVGGDAIATRALLLGSPSIGMERSEWSVEGFLSTCREHGGTLAPMVPTQLYDLVEAEAAAPETLRAAIIGGGPLEPELRMKAESLGWPVRETYGMTEAGSHVAAEPEGGGAMEILAHWEVRTDGEARLWLRGPALFSGYLVPAAGGGWSFERPMDAEGWFRSEDRIELQDRTLRVLGRDSSVVKILGELVDVEAVERRFLALSGYGGRAAVIAVDDARKGQSLVLAYEPLLEKSAVERAVADFNGAVPGYERIDAVIAVPEIPRVVLGKIARGVLRSLISRST